MSGDAPDREYATPEGVVEWRPGLCFHSENCFRSLPSVFDPRRRPWIDPDGAPAAEIERVVGECPSGALRWRKA